MSEWHGRSADHTDGLKARLRRSALDALGRSRFGTITAVDTSEPLCALTFDDGPHPRWTPAVLDVLDAHGAKATFFVVGERVEAHPDVMRRIVAGGHALGNHTFSHPDFPRVDRERRRDELESCERTLEPYPQDRRLFRPPFLAQDLRSRYDAFALGYDVVACSVHATDWEERTSDAMAHDLIEGAGPGSIVMLHDVLGDSPDADRSAMIAALDAFLTERSDLRFVTVSDLLDAGSPRRSIWLKRSAARRKSTLAM